MKLISRLLLYIFNELCSLIGGALVIIGILFPFNASRIVNVRSGETFSRDLFGFPIPEPPLWVSNIPLLAGPLGFISKFFSLHGLAVLGVASILWVTGITIYSKRSKNATQQKEVKKPMKGSSEKGMTDEEFQKIADQLGQAMVQNLRRNTTQDDIKNDKDVLNSGDTTELAANDQKLTSQKGPTNLSETPAKTLPESAREKYTKAFLKAGIPHLLVIKDRPGMVTQIINPPYPRPPVRRMTREELEKTADQIGEAMVKNLQYHTTHDDMNMDSIEEKLAKLDKEYPFVPSTNAGRLFSMVRRMKAEKEMDIPINYRSSRIISVNPSLKESKRTNGMSEQEWESFYKNLSEQLERGYPELYRKVVG